MTPQLGDDEPGAKPPLPPLDIEIPDDARALDRDARMLRRERAAAQRRRWVEARFTTRRWLRYGLSGPLLVAVLIVVGLFGALLALFRPSAPEHPRAGPLATAAPSPAGVEGGLLEPLTVRIGRTERPVRTLRPAVLALLPEKCRCVATVNRVVTQAAEFNLRVYLVTPRGAPAREAGTLAEGPGHGAAVAVDADGRLAREYAATGVTLLFVRSDGVVVRVLRDAATVDRLEPFLSRLHFPANDQ